MRRHGRVAEPRRALPNSIDGKAPLGSALPGHTCDQLTPCQPIPCPPIPCQPVPCQPVDVAGAGPSNSVLGCMHCTCRMRAARRGCRAQHGRACTGSEQAPPYATPPIPNASVSFVQDAQHATMQAKRASCACRRSCRPAAAAAGQPTMLQKQQQQQQPQQWQDSSSREAASRCHTLASMHLPRPHQQGQAPASCAAPRELRSTW
jgi:hypothetical protein